DVDTEGKLRKFIVRSSLSQENSTSALQQAVCPLQDPYNGLGCHWDWTKQAFVGDSCVVSPVQCLCTHLTDFKPVAREDVGDVGPPKMQTASVSDMTSVGADDLMKSVVLLAAVFSVIGTAVSLAILSVNAHHRERSQILASLVKPMGTGVHSFMEVRTAWTWSLFGEDRGEGVTRQSDRVKHQRRLERKAALDNTGMLDVGDGETAAERQQRAKERQAAAAASGREAEQAAKGVIPGLESRAVTAAPLPDGPVMYDDVPSIMGTPETTWKSNGPQMLSGEFGPKGHLMTPLRAAGKKSERTAAGRLTAASRVSQIGQRINAAVTKLQQVNANQGDDHMAVDGETGFELVVASPTGQAVAEAAGSSREVATGRSAGTLRQMHHQLQGGFVAGEEASPEDGGTVGTVLSWLRRGGIAASQSRQAGGSTPTTTHSAAGEGEGAHRLAARAVLEGFGGESDDGRTHKEDTEVVGEEEADALTELQTTGKLIMMDEELVLGSHTPRSPLAPRRSQGGSRGTRRRERSSRSANTPSSADVRSKRIRTASAALLEGEISGPSGSQIVAVGSTSLVAGDETPNARSSRPGTESSKRVMGPSPLQKWRAAVRSVMGLGTAFAYSAHLDQQIYERYLSEQAKRIAYASAAPPPAAVPATAELRSANHGEQQWDEFVVPGTDAEDDEMEQLDTRLEELRRANEDAAAAAGDKERSDGGKSRTGAQSSQGGKRPGSQGDGTQEGESNSVKDSISAKVRRARGTSGGEPAEEGGAQTWMSAEERAAAEAAARAQLEDRKKNLELGLKSGEKAMASLLPFARGAMKKELWRRNKHLEEVASMEVEDMMAVREERKRRSRVSPKLKRRVAMKLLAYARLTHVLKSSQDLHWSEWLCKTLSLSLPMLRTTLPMEGLRELAVGKGTAAQQEQRWDSLLHAAEPGAKPAAGAKKLKKRDQLALLKAARADGSAEVELPVERMLGTALVLAFMDMRGIVHSSQAQEKTRCAAELPWELSLRPLEFYVEAFKALLHLGNKPDWFERHQLWHLLLLQQPDGSFACSEGLATVLAAGNTAGMWEDDPTPDMTVKEIQRSLPKALDAILPTDVAERVWATLLARAGYLRQPFAWVANPDASAKKQTYLDSYIDLYLQQQTQKFSSLEAELPELKLAAKSAVNQWEAAKLEAMAKLKLRVERDSTVADGNMSLRELQQKSATRLYQNTYLLFASHPWVQIRYLPCTAAISRAQHVLVAANSMLLMLFVTLMFYYSKGSICCVEYKEYLNCEAATVDSLCWEMNSCAQLYSARDSGELQPYYLEYRPAYREYFKVPIDPQGYECTAFPQETLMGRVWSTLITLMIIMPISMLFMALFALGGHSAPPAHWRPSRPGKDGAETRNSTWLQVTLYMLLTVMLDMHRLGQALAHLVFMHMYLLRGVTPYLKRYAMKVKLMARQWIHTVWFMRETMLRHRSPESVLQELEMKVEIQEQADRDRASASGQFLTARQESDSLCVQFAYMLLTILWAMTVWVLLTYGMLIRDMLGSDAENNVIKGWAIALVVDNLMVHVIKSVGISLLVNFASAKMKTMGMGTKAVYRWYEGYITQYLQPTFADSDLNNADPLVAETVMFGMPIV
ncbi:hypothetical protein CYMTET_11740, partial [Cymbomonas tetramitiformis]